MKMWRKAGLLAILLFLARSPEILAHDLWLEKTSQRWTLYQGHRHSSHAGAETIAYADNFVTAARCVDGQGNKRPLSVTGTAPWTASGDCAALVVDVSSGYWSKTPWETKNVPKKEAPGAIKSWLSKDSLKRIDVWSPAFAHALGSGLEIVPTTNPLALKPGDKLVVRVMRAGQPVSGAPVAYHGETRGETDAEGRVAIRLRHPGVQLVSTSIELPLNDGKADVESLSATLQFEIKP